MKKIYLILILTFLLSCNKNNESKEEYSRIKFIEEKNVGSYRVRIIEVDGVEYLSTYQGGFIKLEKMKIYE